MREQRKREGEKKTAVATAIRPPCSLSSRAMVYNVGQPTNKESKGGKNLSKSDLLYNLFFNSLIHSFLTCPSLLTLSLPFNLFPHLFTLFLRPNHRLKAP